MTDMTTVHDRQRIVFDIPSRGIIGLRSNLLTATAGEAVMSHRLKGFEPYKGDMEMRQNGSLIAMETGTAYAYAINKLQDRGTFFVSPQDEIYAGQVVGESTRSEDIVINLTKSKKLTNMRASGSGRQGVDRAAGHFLARGSARIYQGGRVCRGDAQVDPPAQDHSRRDDAQASGEIAGFPGPP